METPSRRSTVSAGPTFAYLEARDRMASEGTLVVPLMQNFRLTRDLIDAYNHILDASVSTPFFDGEIRYRPMQAAEWVIEELDGSPAMPVHLLKVELAGGDLLSTGELKRGWRARSRIARPAIFFGQEGPSVRAARRQADCGRRHLYAHGDKQRSSFRFRRPFARPRCLRVLQTGRSLQTDEARAILDLLAAIADPADADRVLEA